MVTPAKQETPPAKRNHLAIAVLCAALLLAVTACQSGSSNGQGSAGSSANTLVVAINDDPTSLNPIVSSSPSTMTVSNVWSEGLWYLDGNYKPVPVLAKSWDVANDGKDVTIHLQEAATWQDGKPFTADDVVFTLTNIAKLSARAGSFLAVLESATAVDPQTVKLSLKKAYGPLFAVLDQRILPMLPKHALPEGDVTNSAFNQEPIGTGPFKVTKWNHGQSITAEANPSYWQGRPSIDKVVFKIIPDAASMTNAMRTGEIDVIGNAILNGNTSKTLKDAGVPVSRLPGTPAVKYLFPNTKNPILAKPEVRKALFTAIDRNAMIEAAFEGYAEPATGMIPAEYAALYDKGTDYGKIFSHSTKDAAKMLDDAGYPVKNGARFKLSLLYSPSTHGAESVAQIIKANLGAVNVTVDVQSLDQPTLLTKVYKEYKFDLAHIGYSTYEDPNLGIDRAYRCDDSGQPYQNPTGYCNAKLDQLLMQAAEHVETSKRQALYQQAQEIVTRDLPVFPLAMVPKYEAYSKRIQNVEAEFDFFGSGDPTWARARLK
ncbi:peptide ABC transporter substrate-binding protein [Streptosporangium violaceochromogenes]|nr:peptide ABC transporter substrate-binding protein [Streptosporangium violaceochromogenes]